MSEVGFEPTPTKWTATWTQRLRPLGHPDLKQSSILLSSQFNSNQTYLIQSLFKRLYLLSNLLHIFYCCFLSIRFANHTISLLSISIQITYPYSHQTFITNFTHLFSSPLLPLLDYQVAMTIKSFLTTNILFSILWTFVHSNIVVVLLLEFCWWYS